jgi:Zn-dependent protease
MRGPWRIARLMGIDIFVDASWFLILFLMVYSLGFLEFPRALFPQTFFPRATVFSVGLGIGTSLLLFGSVLAHEMAHAWMAVQFGIPVTNITLFIFGGVAQIAEEPDQPATEFLVAIMGPLMSVALTTIFGAAWLWLRILESADPFNLPWTPFILLTGLLAQANGALALFNLAPGFPLDGGRVLRAVLWSVLHDIRRATRIATWLGQALALVLIGIGAWLFLTSFDLNGIWYALIGFFIWNAAREGYHQTVVRELLRGVRVDQLMTRTIELVPPDISIGDFVTHYVLPRREQTFAVGDGAGLLGTITTSNVRRVPRDQWTTQCVRQAMTPRLGLEALAPQQTGVAALAVMARTRAEELPVLDQGQLVGFLGRDELSRFLTLRAEPGSF